MSRNGLLFIAAPLLLTPAVVCAQGTLSSVAPQSSAPTSAEQVINRTESPFTGSSSQEPLTDGTIDLTLQDAIKRGIRYNLGLLLSKESERQSRATRLKELANVLPTFDGTLREQVQKINLQAQGLGQVKLPLPGFKLPSSVGPFSTSAANAESSWNVFDLHSIDSVRAADQNVRAAGFTYNDARQTVVLAVATNYLLVIAADARVVAERAQLETAKSLFQLAADQEKAGLTASIDTLRANVELQSRQQALTEAENQLAKQRITLARTIGLSVHQQFRINDQIPYRLLAEAELDRAFERALQNRPDYLSALAQLRATELQRKAAWDEYLPSLNFDGSYGVIGLNPGSMSPQWTVAGTVKIPIFQGGRVQADLQQADSALVESRARVNDLRGRIEQDVENAVLDLGAAARQIDTATAQLKLANQTVSQAQDRYRAGVTNNIEVIQAQESLASANDSYINSLYAYNIAKVLLARAVGIAEQGVLQYLSMPGTQHAPNPRP